MTKCEYCGLESDYPNGYIRRFCDNCVKDKEVGLPFQLEKEYLKGYGMVSKARLDALDSQFMMPYDRNDGKGDYYVGTRLKNGKILEKTPDFRP